MAVLTPEQFAALRDHVGDEPPDVELQERYDRLGNLRDVAVAVLRARRVAFLAGPASFTLPGVYSQDVGATLRELASTIAELSSLPFLPGDPAAPVEVPGAAVGGLGTLQVAETKPRRQRR